MGTTGKGLPYPESTEFVKDGAGAIQGLAEAVDDRLGGDLFRATVVNEPVANDTDDTLDINMTGGDSSLFTDGGNYITYTGPRCVAILSAQVRWEADASGARTMEMQVNGSEVIKIKDTPDGGAEPHIQALTWPVILDTGDTLKLVVRQTSGSSLDVTDGRYRAVVLGVA